MGMKQQIVCLSVFVPCKTLNPKPRVPVCLCPLALQSCLCCAALPDTLGLLPGCWTYPHAGLHDRDCEQRYACFEPLQDHAMRAHSATYTMKCNKQRRISLHGMGSGCVYVCHSQNFQEHLLIHTHMGCIARLLSQRFC